MDVCRWYARDEQYVAWLQHFQGELSHLVNEGLPDDAARITQGLPNA
jgi:hypothetical protein